MNLFEQYGYVDAHYEHPQTGRRIPWMRILVQELHQRIIVPSHNSNCFSSIQRYRDAISMRERVKEDTPQSVLALADVGDEGEADRFLDQQHHYHGLYFDFDARAEPGETEVQALDRARADLMQVAGYFTGNFDLN